MIWIGTSGYSYPEWKGTFYPRDLAAARMLPYYAERFNTVEINNTFYRMPTEKTVSGWSEQTPAVFKLTLKAPRRITHDLGLRNVEGLVKSFAEVACTLEAKLGVLLFQCAPSLKKDMGLLRDFVACLPRRLRTTLEFRNAAWFADDVYSCLREHNVALCIADSEKLSTPVVATADFGYFRLRDEGYVNDDIRRWSEIIRSNGEWQDTFVYFKHEEEGKGPEFGKMLQQMLA